LKRPRIVLKRSEASAGQRAGSENPFPIACRPTMPPECYRFLDAELHPAQRVLRLGGRDCQVGARAFDLLLALVERRDRLVPKSELLELVWPRVVVEENNLQVHISTLRKLLGARAIATVPGRGYRFVAPLNDDGSTTAETARAAAAPAADVAMASASSPTPRTNLPPHRPALLGRADDVAHVASLLAGHRLVTVVGAGGIGKSRLAQAVGDAELAQWPDGVWWIELAGLSDAALVPHALAQQLGLGLPEPKGGQQTLVDALAPRRMLLVLDNCEHLLEPVADLVERLLRAAPALRVLATSQEPLRLAAEQQYRLDPLAVPRDASVPGARGFGALVLFESRVRAAMPRFELADADLPLAIDLCRQLDGMPLAIELAAARVPLLGLRTVHARLRERFMLLTAGTRTALRRHQTLRAAMEWSHALLTDAQRALFRRLGVFSGGFTMELAQALCVAEGASDEWAVLEQLSALVEKSLVVADACEPVRYRLLESPRAFALEQLAAAGETAASVQRHAAVMLQFLRRADDGNMDSTMRTDEYACVVLPELDNLRAAYTWAAGEGGDRQVAVALAAHAGPLIDYSSEFADWLVAQRAYLETDAADAPTRARFWRGLAANNMLGVLRIPEMLDAAERATAAYRQLQRPRRLFSALRQLAISRRHSGDTEGAALAIEEAARLIEPGWPAEFRIVVLRFRAWTSRVAGQHDIARSLYAEGIRLAREAGDWRLEVIERSNASDHRWELGQLDEAEHELSQLIAELRLRPASDYELVEAMSMCMAILCERGQLDEAVAMAREALPVMRRMPRFRLEHVAMLLWRRGRPDAAARVLGAQAARERAQRDQSLINEARIANETLEGLRAALPRKRLAAELALGEGIGFPDVCALLAETLEGPSG
jgi:predicted ATPase/DNA-binding winged helix-turn-helix (wHTH) protein